MKNRTAIILVVALAALVAIIGLIGRPVVQNADRNGGSASSTPAAEISYACDAGKSIQAAFYDGPTKPPAHPGEPPTPGGRAHIALSDGRTLDLAQTISADGVRYANSDESFVFWTKGNGALVLEGNQEKSYIGCIRVTPLAPGSLLTRTYHNGTDGFTIRTPQDYAVDPSYAYEELGPGKAISGVKFTIPKVISQGTNLADDTYVSVEEIPRVAPGTCSADLFLWKGVHPISVSDGGTEYSVATSSGAGAGNRYEETVYALPYTDPCVAIRYFVHYGVIENYPTGSVREFDRQGLLEEFDAIRRTLVVNQ